MSYFTTAGGREIRFADIDRAIAVLHPTLSGRHIFDQLEALGLTAVFQAGDTPVGLPYTFTGCANEARGEKND